MKTELVTELEKQVEENLKISHKQFTHEIDQAHNLLDQEYRKEIDEQIQFLNSITVIAGVVAPFSLILFSVQSLKIQTDFLLLGFVILLLTILFSLNSSRKILGRKYKDTTNLAFDHIISRVSIDDLINKDIPISKRIDSSTEILECIFDIQNRYSDLGLTNKLAELRNSLFASNQWSMYFFFVGLVLVIVSIVYFYIVDVISNFLFPAFS
jgi:hypothetical protein